MHVHARTHNSCTHESTHACTVHITCETHVPTWHTILCEQTHAPQSITPTHILTHSHTRIHFLSYFRKTSRTSIFAPWYCICWCHSTHSLTYSLLAHTHTQTHTHSLTHTQSIAFHPLIHSLTIVLLVHVCTWGGVGCIFVCMGRCALHLVLLYVILSWFCLSSLFCQLFSLSLLSCSYFLSPNSQSHTYPHALYTHAHTRPPHGWYFLFP